MLECSCLPHVRENYEPIRLKKSKANAHQSRLREREPQLPRDHRPRRPLERKRNLPVT